MTSAIITPLLFVGIIGAITVAMTLAKVADHQQRERAVRTANIVCEKHAKEYSIPIFEKEGKRLRTHKMCTICKLDDERAYNSGLIPTLGLRMIPYFITARGFNSLSETEQERLLNDL